MVRDQAIKSSSGRITSHEYVTEKIYAAISLYRMAIRSQEARNEFATLIQASVSFVKSKAICRTDKETRLEAFQTELMVMAISDAADSDSGEIRIHDIHVLHTL